MLRITPYDVAFSNTPLEAEVFPVIVKDIELHGVDAMQVEAFSGLPSVGEALRGMVPPDAPAEAFEQYRALIYHGFHYWSLERPTYEVPAALARYLVEAQPRMEGWEVAAPHPSLYLQLPANLFWGSVTQESAPEPVDGMFVTGGPVRGSSGPPYQRLEVLLVLGLRRDRAGFSIIPIETEAGTGIAPLWGATDVREEGSDFETTLPGGELSGLYSLLTIGEVLKLVGRVLWYMDSYPGDISALIRPLPGPSSTGSRTPYRTIELGSGGGEVVP